MPAAPTQRPCGVPGCPLPVENPDWFEERSSETSYGLCCEEHSRPTRGRYTRRYRENDGIIDYEAINVKIQRLRPVKLSYPETLVAAGVLMSRGCSRTQILNRVGLDLNQVTYAKVRSIAEAYLKGDVA